MYILKELVAKGNTVKFTKYHDGDLWYTVVMAEDNYHDGLHEVFEFPVPISDIGNATFLAEDKSILFMRYIRKHMELLAQAAKDVL